MADDQNPKPPFRLISTYLRRRSATPSPKSSSKPSLDLHERVRLLADRLQLLVLLKPRMAIFLLGLVEMFVESALRNHDDL
jgi:hypothetical protein